MADSAVVSKDDMATARMHMDRVNQVKADFEERNKGYERIEKVVFQKIKPRVPRGFPNTRRVQSPLAPHIINTIVAALTMNPYKVQFDPVSIGPAGEKNATLREHFMDAAWRRQERESGSRLYRLFVHSIVMKGEGVLKTIERSKTAWAGYDAFAARLSERLLDPADREYGDVAKLAAKGDYSEHDRVKLARTQEKKREMPYPISTSNILPETFYYIRGENGFSYAAEVKQVPYFDTLERNAMGLDTNGKVVPVALGLPRNQWTSIMGKVKTLTMVESWDWQDCCYMLAGPGDDMAKGDFQYVKTIQHGYGDPDLKTLRGPYFHSFGLTTSSREQHLMGLSVLFGFLELFPWLDELLTILGSAAYQYGYPRFRRREGPGSSELQPHAFSRDAQDVIESQETVEPGEIVPWNVEPIDMPRSGPDLSVAIKICRDLIQLILPDVVQGAVQGDESGYLMAQATHLARLVWQPIVDNVSFSLEGRTAFESWLIDQMIMEDVTVWGQEPIPAKLQRRPARNMWLTMGPSDINNIHAYTVRIDPSTPSQDVIKLRSLDEALKLKLITQAQAVTEYGGNPDQVELGWMLDTLKAQLLPEIILAAKQKITAQAQQQAQDLAGNENNGSGGADNGLAGTVNVTQPGQAGQPIQPTPPGGGGQTDVSAAGAIGAQPVTPNPPQQPIPA